MASIKLGEGFVELTVDDRKYHAAMARAEARLKGFAATVNGAFQGGIPGLATAATRLDRFRKGLDDTANSARALTRASIALNAAMGGRTGSQIAAVVRATGTAQAAMSRGSGAQGASVIRAQGAAQASVIRAQGAQAAAVVRATGTAARNALGGMASVVRAAVSPISGAVGALGRIGGGFGRGLGRLANPAALIGGVGGALSIGGAVGFSAREAMALEDRMASLRRITGAGAAELAKMRGEFTKIATTMAGVSTDDVFGIAQMGAKLGIAGPSLVRFTKDVSMLSVALDDIPVEEATERIARLLNVFGRGPEDTRRFASAMVALDNASTASAQDILDITTRAAPMASLLRMPAASTMALATALREAGVSAEVAGSSLTQLIGRMAESKNRGAFARVAGMDRGAFGKLVGASPLDAIRAVATGIGRMDQTQAVDTLGKLGLDGVRARTSLLALAGTLPKLSQYLEVANGQFQTADALTKAVGIRSETASAQIQLLWNQLKLAGAEAGRGFLPAIKGAARGLSDLAADVRGYLDSQGGAIDAWGERIGRTLRMVGVVWREWPTVVSLAKTVVQEKAEQIQEVFARLPTALENSTVMYGNYLEMMTEFLGDLGYQLGRTLGQSLVKGMASALPDIDPEILKPLKALNPMAAPLIDLVTGAGKNLQVDPVVPNMGILSRDRLMSGLPGGLMTGLPDGLFGNLPNRNAEARPLEDRIAAARRQRDDAAAGDNRREGDAERIADNAKRQRRAHRGGVFLPAAPPRLDRGQRLFDANRARRLEANAAFRRARDAFNAGVRPPRRVSLDSALGADQERQRKATESTDRRGQVGDLQAKATERLEKAVDGLTKAFASLQANGVPVSFA